MNSNLAILSVVFAGAVTILRFLDSSPVAAPTPEVSAIVAPPLPVVPAAVEITPPAPAPSLEQGGGTLIPAEDHVVHLSLDDASSPGNDK